MTFFSPKTGEKFRHGKGGEAEAGLRERDALVLGEQHAAPVHDAALGEKGNAAQHAQKDHDAPGQSGLFLCAVGVIGEVVPAAQQEERYYKPRMERGDDACGEARRIGEEGIEARRDEAAHAVEGMHGGHDAPPGGALHEDRIQIDGHVEGAHGAAQQEQHRHVRPENGEMGQKKHRRCREG